MNLKYQSSALQDRFVAHLLNFKKNGFYLDIGSCHAESCNNTFCFDGIWEGICMEINPEYTDSYKQRTCKHIEGDATKINYSVLFKENNVPNFIDYLSLDVDAVSTEVLKRLPIEQYKFGIITIEHDQYLNGDVYRNEQREILKEQYNLVCADVLVPLAENVKEGSSFEDWWCIKTLDVPQHIYSSMMYPKEIIAKF